MNPQSLGHEPLGLFAGYGVEIETMIVDADTGAVRPLADVLLHDGETIVNEIERDPISWSNELVAHVVELKTS